MKFTRRLRWGATGAGLLLVAVFLVMRPEPLSLELVEVTPGPLSVTIDEDGLTRFRRHETVAAPITGRLLPSALRAGDSVTRGQVIARIAPAPLDERSRTQAEAALAATRSMRAQSESRARQAEVLLDQARRDRARAERLGAAGAMAARDVEASQSEERLRERDLDAARSAIDAAKQAERQAAQALLGSGPLATAGAVDVRSPLSGRVLRLVEEHERVVIAGTPMLDVGSGGDVEVDVDVLSSDAARIRPGTRMIVRVPDGPELDATVARIEPAAFTKISPLGVEEQRVNVVGRFSRPPVGLGHGFRVATSIVLWSAESVLAIPSSSLVPSGEGWGVLLVQNGRARLQPITIGHQGKRMMEVVGGLEANDLIILHPDERVRDGTRVTGK